MTITTSNPDYHVDLIDDVVVIFDHDARARNDIQNVLIELDETLNGLGSRPVLYRDSTKTFDGIHHKGAMFRGFYPISETVLERAILKSRSNEALY